MTRRLLWTMTIGCLAAGSAAAAPLRWGVGPSLLTGYQLAPVDARAPGLPQDVEDFDWGSFTAGVGGSGLIYLQPRHRLTAQLGVQFGWQSQRLSLLAGYHYALPFGPVDLLFGGRLGGATHWAQDDGSRLRVGQMPLQAETGFIYRDPWRAYEFTVHAGYDVPLAGVWTNPDDFRTPAKGGGWWRVGGEFTVWFGRFVPDKVRKDTAEGKGRRRVQEPVAPR